MPRAKYGKYEAIRQAKQLQALCISNADRLNAELELTVEPTDRAKLATALAALAHKWAVLQESVRVLRGQPSPGSLRPEEKRRPRRRVSGIAPEDQPVVFPGQQAVG